ncbi:hypothetical protein ABW19_dt0201716 [Dactylella cylindrospora]|nr:hypothetical protein ABW19_dt0201716 [Dactylella cylindrospora]
MLPLSQLISLCSYSVPFQEMRYTIHVFVHTFFCKQMHLFLPMALFSTLQGFLPPTMIRMGTESLPESHIYPGNGRREQCPTLPSALTQGGKGSQVVFSAKKQPAIQGIHPV